MRTEHMQMTPTTFQVSTYCDKELTGVLSEAESLEDVSCKPCYKAVELKTAREMDRLNAEMAESGEAVHEAPPVFSTPETIHEPRTRHMSPGRIRHGMIRQQRALRRRAMKMKVKATAS
jgi:hypothetical protein